MLKRGDAHETTIKAQTNQEQNGGTDYSFLPGKVFQLESDGEVHVYHQSQYRRKIENYEEAIEEDGHDCQILSSEPTRLPDRGDQVNRYVDDCVEYVNG